MPVQPNWMQKSLTLAILLLPAPTVPAQDWQTVDDFALASGDAEAHGVAVDAAGRVYVVGTANGHAIVRSSDDGGSSWIIRDDFLYQAQTSNNIFNAITIDPQGTLFVGGVSALNVSHWITRRSTDQGVTWQVVDDYYAPRNGPEPGTNGNVFSLSNDGQGRVYAAGSMQRTGPSYPSWLVRGSDNAGTNWDNRLLLFSGYAEVSQLTCAGQDLYVTGATSDSVDNRGYIVRSGDYGATWTTNFAGTNEVYNAITSDSAGNVYCAGNGGLNSGSVDWLVRKAAPGGTNWAIIDSSNYGDTCACGVVSYPQPRSIAIDAAGNICVAGRYQNHWVIDGTTSTTEAWFTRQYTAATGQWNTTDRFSYSTNSHETALGTAIAPDGSTFVVGYGITESGQRRWVVRKQARAAIVAPPPQLQIARNGGTVSVSWPTGSACSLEWTDSLDFSQPWHACNDPVNVIAGRNTVTVPIMPGLRFFRLKSTAAAN